MASKAKIRAEADRILGMFIGAGAHVVEADILLPAAALLDLYGEDIRARTYVTQDPLRGEQMLRPDFTVPVVQMHMNHGAEPARYAYAGEVFRRQEENFDRPVEYFQVGFELFDRTNPAKADAEVFALVAQAVGAAEPKTGDIGILIAAVQSLQTTEKRKTALMRHIWRPGRFRQLLERFSGQVSWPKARLDLVTATDPFADAGPQIGLRSRAEVSSRVEALKDDHATSPISKEELSMIGALTSVAGTSQSALQSLRKIASEWKNLSGVVDRFEARLEALAAQGVNASDLPFEASYGLTGMEYYDGFVFGFWQGGDVAIASGGRYDALTRQLGQGREIPAVGAVVRPGLLLEARP